MHFKVRLIMNKNLKKTLINFLLIFFLIFSSFSCVKWNPQDARNLPSNSQERARKNVEEGRGVGIGNVFGGNKSTNYEFSTSNPLWRASLDLLDFIPLSVIDYPGGIIITDWYNQNSSQDSIKITIRFLSTEVRANNVKVIVHKKVCDKSSNLNCKIITESNSKISEELSLAILKNAAKLEAESKIKK